MNTPQWQIFKDGTATPVPWKDHQPNPRFALYTPAGAKSPDGDVVLDKETGLVWARNANVANAKLNWLDANTTAREVKLAHRLGWRLPTVEELSSLIDTTKSDPALPAGHPFVGVQLDSYWTCTNHEQPAGSGQVGSAWFVNLASGDAGLLLKDLTTFLWPVRGGVGGVNWDV